MKSLLLTGFDPFDGHALNPSQLLVRSFHGRVLGDCRIQGLELPCEFDGAWSVLRQTIEKQSPVAVVCLGLAHKRAAITPERIAINLIDARIPDNSGRQPIDAPVVAGGPVGYWSTLPIKAMVDAIRAVDIPAEISDAAGTYVCNALFYQLMHSIQSRPSVLSAGFVHIPAIAEMIPGGLALDRLESGMMAALGVVARQAEAVLAESGELKVRGA